jgi:hypothetical protein
MKSCTCSLILASFVAVPAFANEHLFDPTMPAFASKHLFNTCLFDNYNSIEFDLNLETLRSLPSVRGFGNQGGIARAKSGDNYYDGWFRLDPGDVVIGWDHDTKNAFISNDGGGTGTFSQNDGTVGPDGKVPNGPMKCSGWTREDY